MEAFERLLATLRGEKPDRTPWLPLIFGAAYAHTGHSLSEYLHHPEIMAAGQVKARQYLNADALFVFGDNAMEAEALGCRLDYSRPFYPYVTQILLDDWDKDNILPPWQNGGNRIPVLLEVCRRLKQSGGGFPIIAHVLGPVTLAAQLFGMEEFLYFAADFPEKVPSLLGETRRVGLEIARAYREAGADAILVGDPCASPSFFPAEYYRRWMLKEHQALMRGLAEEGVPIRWLMVTGNVTEILSDLARTGADVLTVDYMVSLDAALAVPAAIIAGGLKPHLFALPDSDELYREISGLVERYRRRPDYWLSTGCELPLEADWNMLKRFASRAGISKKD
ncbi:Uroporphyrinogen decarboxylase [Acididesulfobacillus acetoxydans]|uniref:Uroporphyrinogen decarboxylase n=1 Tax=Acididesulfobacillus acetoxydans TaxID=1561005 RepID=A0A8S0W6Q3_9FIRM|nr:uroporphyrinogen decarboxylase family protein [Acididesulfobacillus acetoxydans]CAA7600059.1 Uroporphyrinogen decarboxylase [Acididesulfobacillus acetoxydans]CEJ07834.1 Uroporphyrinogen decarboxylase (URO-D) [Acididesulfobacillus acetoxydans]